jgi:hypothetical protein
LRDFQKSKVYKWERQVVSPRTNLVIPFDRAQMFVDGVWMSLGLIGPPVVTLMANQATRVWATGERTQLQLRHETPAWVILHELAHALTMDFTGHCDGHGPKFVGAYMKLLDKVLNIPLALTMYSAEHHGIKYEGLYEKQSWSHK